MCVSSLLETFLQYKEPSVRLKTRMLCLYHKYLEINVPTYYSNNILGVLCMTFIHLYCVCVCVCVCNVVRHFCHVFYEND